MFTCATFRWFVSEPAQSKLWGNRIRFCGHKNPQRCIARKLLKVIFYKNFFINNHLQWLPSMTIFSKNCSLSFCLHNARTPADTGRQVIILVGAAIHRMCISGDLLCPERMPMYNEHIECSIEVQYFRSSVTERRPLFSWPLTGGFAAPE